MKISLMMILIFLAYLFYSKAAVGLGKKIEVSKHQEISKIEKALAEAE